MVGSRVWALTVRFKHPNAYELPITVHKTDLRLRYCLLFYQ